MDKILRPTNAGVAGIFFPIGRLDVGGTCQYASDICLKHCYALKKDYDERINIPEEEKWWIFNYFISKPMLDVCNEIIKEMGELQAIVLSWFASGDCPDRDIAKLYGIMVLLDEAGVVQNGFTRNVKLYDEIIDGGKIKHILLTVESKDVGDAPSEDYPRGLWAIPDYKEGVVKLYKGKLAHEEYGGCGFNAVVTKFKGKEIEIATNCLACYKRKIGCFIDVEG